MKTKQTYTDIVNQRGVAMAATLLFSTVLFMTSGVFLLRVTHENRMIHREIDLKKTFYAAQSGSQLALAQLDTLINTYLRNTINSANPSSVIKLTKKRVQQKDSIGWLVYSVRLDDTPLLTQNDLQAEFFSSVNTLNDCTYQYRIYITQKQDPYAVSVDVWEFPFFYKIVTTANIKDVDQAIYLSGDFTVRVQRDNFAKYALFTNNQTDETGTQVWFTDKTNFSGPVHTNDRLNFALNPSGTFQGLVTQEQQTARFYNNGSSILLDANANGNIDVPVFQSAFNRNVEEIELTSPVQQDDMSKQARGGKTFNQNGIHIPRNGTTLCGGIYVRGDGSVSLSVVDDNPVYTIVQGANQNKITLDKTNNQTIVENLANGQISTYTGLPTGQDDVGTIIFVQGNITGLSGTVQNSEEVTISSSSNITINNHLRYQDFTPGSGTPGSQDYIPPTANDTTNMLGLVAWGGNVSIGTSAPNNIDVHATILARNGVFRVDNYQFGSPRGTATLLGGMVTNNYGAFGQFNGTTGQQVSGYGRNFVYDDRMLSGNAPPYFPTLNAFIAFTNDLTNKIIWQTGE